jgi:hypothetical protein
MIPTYLYLSVAVQSITGYTTTTITIFNDIIIASLSHLVNATEGKIGGAIAGAHL